MTTARVPYRFGTLVGSSGVMRAVFGLAEKAAKIDLPTLISGETGTGKDMLAREIHQRSRRAGKPFVALNTGVISKELMVSELFGHVKGAFTGATEHKAGRFLEADGGTLFLDEINTMDEAVQVALLRVLETGAFRPVGAHTDEHSDVRIIAATNTDLRDAVDAGEFRADLFHRFSVLYIPLPALRERSEDIRTLIDVFLADINAEFDLHITGFGPGVLESLQCYPWTGNVRELKNTLAQACIMAEKGDITLEYLPARVRDAQASASPKEASVFEFGSDGSETQAVTVKEGVFMPLGASLEEAQRTYVLRTLDFCGNNKTRAAKMLGVSRKTLYDRLGKWGQGHSAKRD